MVVSIGDGDYSQDEAPQDDSADPVKTAKNVANTREEEEEGENDVYREIRQSMDRAFHHLKARSVMHRLPELVDASERLGNALSPTIPFNTHKPRFIIGAAITPFLLISYFSLWSAVIRVLEICFGIVFFGQPALRYYFALLTENFPKWKEYLQLKNTILRDVPTNAQLTLTILRVGEKKNTPFPPPPQGQQEQTFEKTEIATSEGLDDLGKYK